MPARSAAKASATSHVNNFRFAPECRSRSARCWPIGALGLDALASTHPIYAPVRSVAEATENFDLITYEKGAAVVRMVEHYLGADTFRDGVRRYIQRHRESNAVAADLWRALGEASGTDVARLAQSWIGQAGFPLVTLARNGRALRVRQERFFADPRVAQLGVGKIGVH